MKPFKDVADGEVSVGRGGFELIRVNENNGSNSVLVEDSSLGLKAAYPEDSEAVELF